MYIILIYILLAMVSMYLLNFQKAHTHSSRLIFVVTIAFFTLRFNQGADTASYIMFFERVTHPILDSFTYLGQRNVGFNILLYYTKFIVNDFQFFLLVFNIIVMGLCSYVIYRYSDNTIMSLMLFVGSGVLEIYYSSALRQMLAMTIFFVAFFKFLKKKQYVKYYILVIIACLFHETSFVTLFIPMISLFQEKIWIREKIFFYTFFSISIIFVLFFGPTISYISSNFDFPTSIQHIMNYFGTNTFSLVGTTLRCVTMLLIIFLYVSVDKNKVDDFLRLQVYACVFSCLTYISLSRFSVIGRLSDFIEIIMIITVVNLLGRIDKNIIKNMFFVFIFIFNFVLLYVDLDSKVDYVTGIENAKLADYKYISLFSDESNEIVDSISKIINNEY